jgi:multicomponent Na+:H+ antiporter subunit C
MGRSVMATPPHLLLVSLAYRKGSTAPVLIAPSGRTAPHLAGGNVADPVLQNFCLTAIVIGVAVTAVFLTVVVRLAQHRRSLDADDQRELRG